MCVCVLVCLDKRSVSSAKGQVTTCEKEGSKQKQMIVKPAVCLCVCLCVCLRERICHPTSDSSTEIFITAVTANPYVCTASGSPSLNWVSPARSTSASEWELSLGEVKCEGVNFSAFCLSICTSLLRQPRCFQMSAQCCSINMISLPAPLLFLSCYPNQ